MVRFSVVRFGNGPFWLWDETSCSRWQNSLYCSQLSTSSVMFNNFNNFIDWFDYLIIWDEVPTMVEIAIFWFQIHITNGLNFMHRKWHTGNQYMVKSAENRMRSNLEGCRTFRNLVDSYQFRTFFSTHRFVINSLIKMLYV